MEIDKSELYRMITRTFPRSHFDDVHDVIQATMAYAWERSQLREQPLNAQAYATVIAKRMMLKLVMQRRRYLYPDRESSHGWETLQEEEECLVEEHTPDASVDVQQLLSVLPDHYAMILRRHYLEGAPLRVIADEVHVTHPTMRKRHQRALQLARRFFGIESIPVADP